MIDFIEGHVAYTELDYIVIETGGIGYRIFCGNPFHFSNHEGSIRLFTHHYVREDAIHLYGFATREERMLFRMLLEVSGIGPRGAMAVVSSGSPVQIATAIQQEDIHFLTKFPGIGKKTAQRMILDLKDKMIEFADSKGWEKKASSGPDSHGYTHDSEGSPLISEAVEALKALGYHEKEIEKIKGPLIEAVTGDESPSWTIDKVVKKALQFLMTR